MNWANSQLRKWWLTVSFLSQNVHCLEPSHPFFCKVSLVRILFLCSNHIKILTFGGNFKCQQTNAYCGFTPLNISQSYREWVVNVPLLSHLHRRVSALRVLNAIILTIPNSSCHSCWRIPVKVIVKERASPCDNITSCKDTWTLVHRWKR